MTLLTYYPGCSLKTSSSFYETSLRKVLSSYGVELRELDDWSCCGATASQEAGEALDHALVARNLGLAEQEGRPFFTPCSACYSRSKITNHLIGTDKGLRDRINRVIHPLQCLGSVDVKNIIEVMAQLVTGERVASQAVYDLSGLRVVPYYGCVLTRMIQTKPFDDPEEPTSMDRLLSAAGTTVIQWPFKLECCGASKTITDRDITARLSGRVMDMAVSAGADAIVTPCPLCQMNLDLLPLLGRKDECVPTLFFSEIFELALFGRIAGRNSHLIPVDRASKKVQRGGERRQAYRNLPEDERGAPVPGRTEDMEIGNKLEFVSRFDPDGAERLKKLLQKRESLMAGNVYGERFTERQFLLAFQPLLDAATEQARILEALTDRTSTVAGLSGLLNLDPGRVFSHMKELLGQNKVRIEGFDGRDPVYGRGT